MRPPIRDDGVPVARPATPGVCRLRGPPEEGRFELVPSNTITIPAYRNIWLQDLPNALDTEVTRVGAKAAFKKKIGKKT